MDYINKISSLQDKASAKVAINLCQEDGFKEVALNLEKPTYGGFISSYDPSYFVSDPGKLSMWAKVKEDDRLLDDFMKSCYLNNREMVRRWDTAVDEQIQRLMEGIPYCLRQGIHVWINRIALEYLSYSRRQEMLFGVSRYFLMNIFTTGNWKETAQLDEKKLALRLLEDERLTVLQRYRIACVYCLKVHIPQLWNRLTQEEKQLLIGNAKRCLSEETHSLVQSWSLYMGEDREKSESKNCLWTYALSKAISCGNRAALMQCWKEFQEDTRQKMVIDKALESLRQWQYVVKSFDVKVDLVSYWSCGDLEFCDIDSNELYDYIKRFNLPSYYSDLMFFFCR